MLYTRIPILTPPPFSQELLNQSRIYFPLVGILIGSICGLILILADSQLPLSIAVALSMVVGILLTGAFHEDGFADSCDALGGGWEKQQVLTIMKDSRIGTYGTVGLVSILGIKFLCLVELSLSLGTSFTAIILVFAHALSRQYSSSAIELFDYVQDIDKSKVKPITENRLTISGTVVSCCITFIPLAIALLLVKGTAIAAITMLVVAIAFLLYCRRRIGGYTGDILGATQQLSEVCAYLVLLLWI